MEKIFSCCVGSFHPSNYFVVIVQTPFNFIEFHLSILVIADQLEPFLETKRVRGRDLVSVFYMGYPVSPEPFVDEAIFSLTYVYSLLFLFCTFVSNQLAVSVRFYLLVLCSISLLCVSVFMILLCCLCHCDYIGYFKTSIVKLPGVPFLLRITLTVWSPLYFCEHFRVAFSTYIENVLEFGWGLYGISNCFWHYVRFHNVSSTDP